MESVKIYLLLFVVVVTGMYFLYYKRGKNPLLLPGDYYRIKGTSAIYIPIGAGIIVTTILYIILRLLF